MANVIVHGTLGSGFQEVIYQRAMAPGFRSVSAGYVREFEMPVYSLGQHIGTNRSCCLADNKMNPGLKLSMKLEEVRITQAINYLVAYNPAFGLLLNFTSKRPEIHGGTNKQLNPLMVQHAKILINLINHSSGL